VRNLKKVLLILVIFLLSVGIGPVNAQAENLSIGNYIDQTRLVVFEGFYNPA
jgi:uncharacterized membrane protein YciS (DUF1049 family)